MNLVIDIGNTLVKIAVFDKETLIDKYTDTILNISTINYYIQKYEIRHGIISTVRENNYNMSEISNHIKLIILDTNTRIPIQNLYETPHTLGRDRIAAAVGGWSMFPNKKLLIIDIGTAITYDYVSEAGEFLGGNISPGITLRYKSLYEFTGKLPYITPANNYPLFGVSTETAIRSGVQTGIVNEINSYICAFMEHYPAGIVIISGGDVKFIADKIKNNSIFEPELVLKGLNSILQYNE
ncbi:MAG: type III pantothenate kinase [Bacteroidales bacterium]